MWVGSGKAKLWISLSDSSSIELELRADADEGLRHWLQTLDPTQEYSNSHNTSKMGSHKGAWGAATPTKIFSMGCSHGADCDCESGPANIQDAAHRTADLASKIAAHSAWSRPGGR